MVFFIVLINFEESLFYIVRWCLAMFFMFLARFWKILVVDCQVVFGNVLHVLR